MVHVAQVAELPDQLGTLLCGADRVVKRYQAAAAMRVHQERIAGRMEQDCLVAGQHQAAIRLFGCFEDLGCLVQSAASGSLMTGLAVRSNQSAKPPPAALRCPAPNADRAGRLHRG